MVQRVNVVIAMGPVVRSAVNGALGGVRTGID